MIGGIETAAHVCADRHVGPKTETCRARQQIEQLLAILCVGRVRGRSRRKCRLPVPCDGHPPVAPRQRVPGRQLVDPFEDRPRRQRRPEREDVVDAERIDLARHLRMREQRFDLGCEEQLIAALRVKQRANTETIARQKQRPLARVPDGECPLAVEPVHGVGAELLVQMQDDFRIG